MISRAYRVGWIVKGMADLDTSIDSLDEAIEKDNRAWELREREKRLQPRITTFFNQVPVLRPPTNPPSDVVPQQSQQSSDNSSSEGSFNLDEEVPWWRMLGFDGSQEIFSSQSSDSDETVSLDGDNEEGEEIKGEANDGSNSGIDDDEEEEGQVYEEEESGSSVLDGFQESSDSSSSESEGGSANGPGNDADSSSSESDGGAANGPGNDADSSDSDAELLALLSQGAAEQFGFGRPAKRRRGDDGAGPANPGGTSANSKSIDFTRLGWNRLRIF